MICDHFDPITASCAPCCAVCSGCRERTAETKEKAALVLEHQGGGVEQVLTDAVTTSIIQNRKDGSQV